jgi:hypothetical protein
MGLIDLKTNLKDLKFGNDEYKGGNSGQPFIQTRIPATDEPLQTSFSLTGDNLTQGLGTVAASAGAGALIGSIAGPAGTVVGAAVGLGIGIAGAVSTQDFNVSLKIPSAGTGGTDFLLRGGTLLPSIIANDEERLAKFFKSTNGILFTVKQNLLSRIAVRTQVSTGILNEGVYTPLSTLAQAGGVAFGLHVNKQGLNPFDGLLSAGDFTPNQYADKVNPELGEIFSIKSENNNRLILLTDSKINNSASVNPATGISESPIDILTYQGGPGSILGIGKTNIRFADQRTGINNPNYGKDNNYQSGYLYSNKILNNILPFSKFNLASLRYNEYIASGSSHINDFLQNFSFKSSVNGNGSNWYYTIGGGGTVNAGGNQLSGYASPSSKRIPNAYGVNTNTDNNDNATYIREDFSNPDITPQYSNNFKIQDFRNILRSRIDDKLIVPGDPNSVWNILSSSPEYSGPNAKNIEKRVNLGDPGSPIQKNLKSYAKGASTSSSSIPKGAASENSYDKINLLSIYSSNGLGSNATFEGEKNDLVKFSISVIDTRQNITSHIHFRAFLDQISDSYNADWQATKYIGRGENFYTYGGFDRKVSLSWTVAAQSKAELIPMYKKLNFLASICAPNYSTNGYMQGNIVKLTVGGYLYEQPGIITGLSYEMNDDNSSWEIGIDDVGEYDNLVKELPHLIKVNSFNFIPIHQFVPRLQQNTFDKNGVLTNYGKERYISLANGNDTQFNNYDS